jgi:hypothetical protein
MAWLVRGARAYLCYFGYRSSAHTSTADGKSRPVGSAAGPRRPKSRQGSARQGTAMPSHKFHVGESVTLMPSISRNVLGGVYQVTKQLPHNGREFEYHIKSANEEHQRIARKRTDQAVGAQRIIQDVGRSVGGVNGGPERH